MAAEGDEYPDRDAWPRYWRAIRTAAVWLLVGVMIVGGGALLPRPGTPFARFAMELLIALAAVTLATFLARRANAWWDETHA